MGIRTEILAVTPTSGEISTCAAAGQDLTGMINLAAQKVADAIEVLNAMTDLMPSGTNKTNLASYVTSLT
jgi:hypothetical protein